MTSVQDPLPQLGRPGHHCELAGALPELIDKLARQRLRDTAPDRPPPG